VADGMGGHAPAKSRPRMAIDTLREFFSATSMTPKEPGRTRWTVRRGTRRTGSSPGFKLATSGSSSRLSATLAARYGHDHRSHSSPLSTRSTSPTSATARVYRVRDGKARQLTEDHSLLNDYIKMKRLTPQEIANFPQQET